MLGRGVTEGLGEMLGLGESDGPRIALGATGVVTADDTVTVPYPERRPMTTTRRLCPA